MSAKAQLRLIILGALFLVLGLRLRALFSEINGGIDPESPPTVAPVDVLLSPEGGTESAFRPAEPAAITTVLPPTLGPTPTAAGSLPDLVYQDQELGFSLAYDPAWELTLQSDGTWQVVNLSRDGYGFRLRVRPVPDELPVCAGVLTAADLQRYRPFTVAGMELWRASVESGFVNGFHHDDIAFIDIVAPTLYDSPDAKGSLGETSCVIAAAGKLFGVEYEFPASLADLQAGAYDAGLLAEMDAMLTSLAFFEPTPAGR